MCNRRSTKRPQKELRTWAELLERNALFAGDRTLLVEVLQLEEEFVVAELGRLHPLVPLCLQLKRPEALRGVWVRTNLFTDVLQLLGNVRRNGGVADVEVRLDERQLLRRDVLLAQSLDHPKVPRFKHVVVYRDLQFGLRLKLGHVR